MTQPSVYPVLPFDNLAPLIDASGDCWEWTGYIDPNGYGLFDVKIGKKWRSRRAHRLVWIALCGPIPGNLPMDHLCRVRHCVNPDHLEPVPGRVNTLRGYSGTALNARKTRCKYGHEDWRAENKGSFHRRCNVCDPLSSKQIPKTHCMRGHERIPSNLDQRGVCKQCRRLWDQSHPRPRKPPKEAKREEGQTTRYCLRGHLRVPENLDAHRGCRTCRFDKAKVEGWESGRALRRRKAADAAAEKERTP